MRQHRPGRSPLLPGRLRCCSAPQVRGELGWEPPGARQRVRCEREPAEGRSCCWSCGNGYFTCDRLKEHKKKLYATKIYGPKCHSRAVTKALKNNAESAVQKTNACRLKRLEKSFCLCTILFMGKRSRRQERSKKLELAQSETMKAGADVQNGREEAEEPKAKDQRLTSVFGVADLKNEAIGLYNVGQSCCLNSLLQVFLMNIHFTGILRRIMVPRHAAQMRRNVPYQMLLLLEEMQHGKRKAVFPTAFARCLSAYRVKLFVQHDAAQLFLTLWNVIKMQMGKPELVEELSDLYTICVQEHLACQKCSVETKRNSSMLTLPLPVLDSNSHKLRTLEDCLQYFFHPEELTDHNMCFCEQCGRKTPFLQSMKLVHLPKTLTIHLKRFCFEKSAYIHKLSHCLPFPQDLDFSAILTEDQCQADDNEKAAWQYELFAVVAHSGSTSYGHYCAYIRSLTEHKWYCFNDSEVCQVSWDDVKCTYGHPNLYWAETAYLLIYMKKQLQ